MIKKKVNSEIFEKVKSAVKDKTEENIADDAQLEGNEKVIDDFLKKEINEWIQENAEKIAKEIITIEIKKLFK